MNDREYKAAFVTAKLDGRKAVPSEVLRDEIVQGAIKKVYPVPFWKTLDICSLSEAAEALGKPSLYGSKNKAFELLKMYHCTGYFSIPRSIRRRIPDLVREALGVTE